MSGVYDKLFPPLRFATRDRLGVLRDLDRLVRDVARTARAEGADEAPLGRLQEAAAAFDAARADEREQAARAVVGALAALTELPPDLAALVGPARAAPATGPRTAPRPSKPPAPAGPQASARTGAKAGAKASAKARPARGKPEEPAVAEDPILPGPAFTRGLLAEPLSGIRGVGPKTAAALEKRHVTKVGHVLFLLPRSYQDRRRLATIRELRPGEKGLTFGTVQGASEVWNPRSRKRFLRVVLADATGKLALTFFHYWPSTTKRFEPGRRFFVWGDVKLFGGAKQIVHPEVEDADADEADASLDVGTIVPEYRGMADVGQGRYRTLVRRVLDHAGRAVPEILPAELRERKRLPLLADALEKVHFPGPDADLAAVTAFSSAAHRRLVYEELFVLSVGLALKQRGVQVEPGHAFAVTPERLKRALEVLPFRPTSAQEGAIGAIARDMAAPSPMNRLLQGDVGSGKTAVAVVAALLAVQDGKQVAVMAPTELLAEQHHRVFSELCGRAGVPVELVAAGRGAKAVAEARRRIASGEARIAVGTHALFEQESSFPELGLAIVDEQHRFGVEQRARLFGKARRPDVLVMTATPIPRTLALVVHGELDQSVLDELPPGRTPVLTKVFSSTDREKAYAKLDAELGKGRQAYVVYPLIEESETSDLEDATRGLASLRARFPGRRLELLHGRMKAEEKDRTMAAFRQGGIDVLVATTVVEVGVDVPNATVMLVEHAERFGLSQLHQLRGRVGRGAARSHCFLVAHGGRGEKARARLDVMEKTTDGFAIAEADLELRGPGEFLGTRQAGLPELTFANLSRDGQLLQEARQDAFALVRDDPDLERPEHRLLREEVFERYRERMSLARVG